MMKNYDSFIIVLALVLGIAGSAGMIYNFQNADDIAFHTHPTHITELPEPFDDSEILQALTNIDNQLVSQRAEYTREIVAVKKDLSNAQIGTGDAQKDRLDEQSGTGTTPGLTITLAASEFIRGEIIYIEGTGQPNQPITATLCLPTEEFTICPKRTIHGQVDKRGTYTMGFATTFNDPLGVWNLFVKSEGQTSETLSFHLK